MHETPGTDSPPEPKLAHISDAADRLGLSRWQTRKLIEAGALRAEKIANRTYVAVESINEYVEKFGRAS
jgi:hypothetical protein